MSTCPECRGKGTLVIQVSGSRVPNIEECDVCEGTGHRASTHEHEAWQIRDGHCTACGAAVPSQTDQTKEA